jgi:CheY-like chemotaxis protein
MAKTTVPDTFVIVDDEIHNMTWMLDYLESQSFKTRTASNVNEASELLSGEIFRGIIVDLNIPVLPPLIAAVAKEGSVYSTFPGLYVAKLARNRGYRDRQVVIYSVHKDEAVAEEARRLSCTYILKGRPKSIKEELMDLVSFDPTADHGSS